MTIQEEAVIATAMCWYDVINDKSASEKEIILAEYNLAQATERLHERRA